MRYLVVLRGLPGAGKSMFIQKYGLEEYTLSSDKYRLMCSSPTVDFRGIFTINQEVSGQAWKNLYNDLEYRMRNGDFTIVDATHTTKKSFDKYRSLCKKYFYRLIVIEFRTSIAECIANDMRRRWTVGKEVIEKMAMQWEELPNSIKKIEPKDFQKEMDSRYNPLNFDNKKIHVIGDIHGCGTALKQFINASVDLDNDIVIFVGDYFDRGIENFAVFEFLQSIIDKDNVFMCIGNHEKRIMSYLWEEDVSRTQFYRNTLEQLQSNNVTDKMLKSFIHKLIPCVFFVHNDKEYIVSHAGVSSPFVNIFLPETMYVQGVGTYEDMDKICNHFSRFDSTIQIFGHRNNNDVPIKINNNCYNVCGFPEYGGDLKAVTIENGNIEEHYIHNDIFSREGYYAALSKYPNRFKIENVKDLIGAFRHNKYVKETEFGNISSFQFTKDAFYEGHWENIVNRARGLFINTNTNEIVARSYDKFFLLGQYDYCTLDKFTPPFRVWEKYDGFLGILGYDKETDSLLYCSKSTLAPWGDFANLFKSKIQPLIKDEEKLKEVLRDYNCSMVFECIAPNEDEHIIKYSKDKIILLDIVERTIEFNKVVLPYHYITRSLFMDEVEMKRFVAQYNRLEDKTIKHLKGASFGEGYVIVDKHGKMFKLKTYEYEAKKLLRNLEEYYREIKEKAGEHDIACPSRKKIEQRYGQYYDKNVIAVLYEGVKDIIERVNNNA